MPTARNVIFLYMTGGQSHLDTWDPKPENKEVMGPTKAISTSTDGVQIGEYLPRMAKQMHHACVLNAMATNTTRVRDRADKNRKPQCIDAPARFRPRYITRKKINTATIATPSPPQKTGHCVRPSLEQCANQSPEPK